MVKIAFCDDDSAVLNTLQEFLDRYRVEKNQELDFTAFHSPLDLLEAIDRGTCFDILLMDVLMPGENGIQAAAEIRSRDKNVKIIFLTSSEEFAVQSYAVGAYYYQLKPIREGTFYHLMDSVLATCEKEQNSSLILRCKNGITRIEPKQLEYCEVIHRTRFFHLRGGSVLESMGSMDELCDRLAPYTNFFRPHRSYVINLDYVQNLSARGITMFSQAEIPIPRGKYNEVKNAFLEYAFQSRQVMI